MLLGPIVLSFGTILVGYGDTPEFPTYPIGLFAPPGAATKCGATGQASTLYRLEPY